jgi:hypothetical protein
MDEWSTPCFLILTAPIALYFLLPKLPFSNVGAKERVPSGRLMRLRLNALEELQ